MHIIAARTWKSLLNDNLFGSAAELGYWFLFALFPTLVSASSIIGLAARHAAANYELLLHYMALVIPPSAYGIVFETFNQITAESSGRKVTFGLAAGLWAASAGFSAIQDSMNSVYKVKETRPYWKVRGSAVLISTLLSALHHRDPRLASRRRLLRPSRPSRPGPPVGYGCAVILIRAAGWVVALGLLTLLFALIYYWAPDVKKRQWRWSLRAGHRYRRLAGCVLRPARLPALLQ